MKNFFKKAVAFVIILTVTFAAFACNSGGDTPVPPDDNPPPVAVTGVTVSGPDAIWNTDGAAAYTAVVTPADAADKTVTWSVTNGTGAATIDAAGSLTPVSAGTVTVKAAAVSDTTKEGVLDVTIRQDDSQNGPARPNNVTGTNFHPVTGAWEVNTDISGITLTEVNRVQTVDFTEDASKNDTKSLTFKIPGNVDYSMATGIALKLGGLLYEDETKAAVSETVKPQVSVSVKDFTSDLPLFQNQTTEIDLSLDSDIEWISFRIMSRYRLTTADRDIRVTVDPHYTASGAFGQLKLYAVAFTGTDAAQTTPKYTTNFVTPHWTTTPDVIDEYDETLDLEVTKITMTAANVSDWAGAPAYVLDDISRFTGFSFYAKASTTGVTLNPHFGDTALTPVTALTTAYVKYNITITAGLRTESNVASIKYLMVKPQKSGGNFDVFIYGLEMTGDANPTALTPVREAGGDDIAIGTALPTVDGGGLSRAAVAATDTDDAHVLVTAIKDGGGWIQKLHFSQNSSANIRKQNALKFDLQGPAGKSITVQMGYGSGWGDVEKFDLNGTRQTIILSISDKSKLLSGSSSITVSLILDDGTTFLNGETLKVYGRWFHYIAPTPEAIKGDRIYLSDFYDKADYKNGIDEDTMTAVVADGITTATVIEQNGNQDHLYAFAVDANLRYMNKLVIEIEGPADARVIVKVSYGNAFNMDVDYVITTTGAKQTVTIDIADRDQLNFGKVSVQLFLLTNADIVTDGIGIPAVFKVYDAYFEAVPE
jgi:hypothetical protein